MPSREVVQRAIRALKRAANYEYFFSRLSSPDWIEPLWDAGFFRRPPEPIREGDYVRFPLWPESQYLARMAPKTPATVCRIALQIPATNNVRVNEDIADVAQGLPADLAAKFAPAASAWLKSRYTFLLPEKLGNLVKHLARGQQERAALRLAGTLFEVVPREPRPRRESAEESLYELTPEVTGLFEESEYAEILRECLPDLVSVNGMATLALLSDLLERAVCLSLRDPHGSAPQDYSYIWRHSIAADPPTGGVRNILVSEVRNVARQLAQRDRGLVSHIVADFEARGWEIFQRLALDLLSTLKGDPDDLVLGYLRQPARYDRPGARREYQSLLREQFARAPKGVQQGIVDWIQGGPPTEEIEHLVEWRKAESKPLDEAEIMAYKDRWKLRHFAPIADNLSGRVRHQYLSLLERFGPTQLEEPPVVGATWVGPTSPKTAAELRKLTVAELAQFLRSWAAPTELFNPSPEGLGRILTEVVTAEPEKYASEIDPLIGLDPTYVRAAIQGFGDAARQGKTFSWSGVLTLCNWVLSQPREVVRTEDRLGERDSGWKWTRNEIARALSSGLARTDTAEIPYDLRDRVWLVLEPLTNDPEPTVDDEARNKEVGMDPLTLSINTNRGNAMHAVMDYSLWVWRHLDAQPSARGFGQITEARRILKQHLDQAKDPSLAIRSVYGQRFPWLVLMDQEWTRSHVQTIFPAAETMSDFFDAAWIAYVKYCEPYDNVFDVLKEQYATGLARLRDAREDERQWRDYSSRLAEHIAILYGRGKIRFGDAPALLENFYKEADLETRSHLLGYVGWSLEHSAGSVPQPTLERFQALWLRRADELLGRDAPARDQEELAPFGSWFASGVFNDGWALEQSIRLLRHGVMPDPFHTVVRRLAVVASTFPTQALECLELVLDIDKRGEKIRFFGDEVRAVIGRAMDTPDSAVRERAIALVHRLGSFGLREYRDLLPGI